MSFINNPEAENHGTKRAYVRPVDMIFPGNARLTALASGTCVMDSEAWNYSCKGNGTAAEFKDGLSRREYEISGLCQVCQDDTFKQEELDEDKEYQCEDCGEYITGDWEHHEMKCGENIQSKQVELIETHHEMLEG